MNLLRNFCLQLKTLIFISCYLPAKGADGNLLNYTLASNGLAIQTHTTSSNIKSIRQQIRYQEQQSSS